MRLDKDSCYVRYRVDPRWGRIVSLEHFIDVDEDWFTIDAYSFCESRIGFEDAGWNGAGTEDVGRGLRVLKRNYDRWDRQVKDLRERLKRLARTSAQPLPPEIKTGDCILVVYDKDEEDGYDYEEFILYQVEDMSNGQVLATALCIGPYDIGLLGNHKKLDVDDEWEGRHVYSIPEAVFIQASDATSRLSLSIMNEIEAMVDKAKWR